MSQRNGLAMFVGILLLAWGTVGDRHVLLGGLAQSGAQAGEGKLKFEVYQDAGKAYRWRLKAANGKVLATAGQSFAAKTDCKKSVERLQNLGKQKFDVYQDKTKEFRWRLVATNGQVIASASQGYVAKADCEAAIELIKKDAPKAEIVEVTDKK